MEIDSSNEELLCPSDCSDNETPHLSTFGTKSRKFDEKQTATLTTYYNTGMKGVGKAFSYSIERAAADTGLSADQVKVG